MRDADPDHQNRTMAKQRSRKSLRVAARGRVKPHDPFELIRWFAYSQPDPRKALAELVQNSLDAGAARVRIVRIRERGVACLRVWDDGEGVIPSLDRVEALKDIATNIDIHYEDRMARGTAQKSAPIRPVRFAGERLGGFDLLVVPEHAPIRLELYTTASGDKADEESRLAVCAAGTLVASDSTVRRRPIAACAVSSTFPT